MVTATASASKVPISEATQIPPTASLTVPTPLSYQLNTSEWVRIAEALPLQYFIANIITESQTEHDRSVARLAGAIVRSFGGHRIGAFGKLLWSSFKTTQLITFLRVGA